MHRYLRSNAARLLVLGAIALAGTTAKAQGVTGSAVTGTIKDPQGAGVEAALELTNTATGDVYKATSNAAGEYFINNVLPGGPYTLAISSGGYEVQKREGLTLTLGERLKLDIPMAYMGETVEIIAHSDRLDDKSRTGASTTLNETTIKRLPLQGRNFTSLIQTSSMVSGSSFAGQNNRYNNIQIDGGANNDLFGLSGNGTPGGQADAKPLSLEAVQEFVVQVAPFDVRQGSFAGGLVNAITKSGTNEFHGSAFGYFQNKTLAGYRDDPNFLDYNTIQYGATFSGPIVKDKVHFFIATDLQSRQSSFGNQFQISGTDSAADIARAGFDNAAVTRFQSILNKYGINGGNALAPSLGNPDHNLFVKVSTNLIENSHLDLTYNLVDAQSDVLIRAPTSTRVPSRLRDGYELSNSGYSQANTTNTVRAKLTTNWDKFSNEFLAGFSIVRDKRALPTNAPLILVKVGKLGADDSYLAAGGERFSQANTLDQNVYQLQDNITYALGRHRLTVGTSNEFLQLKNVFLQAATGIYAFDSLDAFDQGKAVAFERRVGLSSTQDAGTAKFGVSQLGFYAQDEWTILPTLTIQPGIRVDIPFLSTGNGNPSLLTNAAFPIDTAKVPTGNPLWSPRLGLNWDIDGTGDTVVRGGAGIFTGRPPYVWVSNAYSINGLSQVQITCTGANTPAFNADPNAQPTACPGSPAAGVPQKQEIDYFDPNTKYPQNFRLALGADRRLPFGVVASGDFMYTRDVNGWYVNDQNLQYQGQNGENRGVYGTFASSAKVPFSATPARFDNGAVAQAVQVVNENGGHVYNATVQLEKQFAQQYSIKAGYTYSRSMDRMSLTSSQALSNFQFAPVDGDLSQRNVRPGAFDRPHKIAISGSAQLPYGFGVAATYVGQSGTAYTWTVNGDVNGDGINGNDLAYIPANAGDISLAKPAQYDDLSKFIDSQPCLADARGSIVKRGACRNQWQDFLDARLSWNSPEFKGQHAEVQFDIFNVLNLLNSSWGHFDQVAGFENAPSSFLRAVGYDKARNRPIYSFTAPTQINQTTYSPTASRWRMQLGAKYVF